MIKTIIIDDESTSRDIIKKYVEKYCPDLEVIGEADSMKTGVPLINEKNPDLVFLDVEMPFGNAFDLLEQFDEINFKVIFVTAYSQYAIQALNNSASYYLLKPVDIEELIAAVQKVKEELDDDVDDIRTKVLLENVSAESKQQQKLALPVSDGFEIVKMNEIIRCQADDNFTLFYLIDGSKKMICRTLKFYEETLSPFNFYRTHKSHLVNLEYIKAYKKGKGGYLVMTDDSTVDVSPSKKAGLMERL